MHATVATSAGAEARKETFVYKTVGTLPIRAEVFRYDDEQTRPVVVWIHGGALINGHREQLPSIHKAFLDRGYIFISIDYRLAPETQLPGVIADVEDSIRWVREQGPKLFHADAKRIAVTGGSAGGYLTLIVGHRVSPPVQALVPFWGYGDLVGDWYSRPSPHPRHHTIKPTKEEAYQQVAGSPVSDSRDRKGDGGKFYQFCRQHGSWPKSVSGWDPHSEPEKFFPYMPVKNVTAQYPPTLLIHGDQDTDVPYEQSVMMAAEFKKHGVEHRLLTITGGEHGLAGVDKKVVEDANNQAVEFVVSHLKLK